jgi:hypothetical protein
MAVMADTDISSPRVPGVGIAGTGAPTRGCDTMRFTRSQKTWLGFLTLWPFIYVVVFMLYMVGSFFGMLFIAFGIPTPGLFGFFFVLPLHIATMVLALVMTVFWGVQIYQDPTLVGDKKTLWMLVVILGGVAGQAVYFYLNVWPDDPGVGPVWPGLPQSGA